MIGKTIPWLASVSLLGLAMSTVVAQELTWRAVNPTPSSPVAKPDQQPASTTPAVSLGRPEPVVTLGKPQPVNQATPTVSAPYTAGASVIAVNYTPAYPPAPTPTVVRSDYPGDIQPLSGAAPPPPPPPPPSTTYGDVPYNPSVDTTVPLNKSFGDRCREFFGLSGGGSSSTSEHKAFQSDHCFDGIISPFSNPFFFEDPRSLTEVRPLFIYQQAPHGNPALAGGSSEFYGVQGRLAINERWSIVMNKLGFVSTQPHENDDGFVNATGFAELNLGPKWTFYRNEQSGGIAAGGLNFEIPVGDRKVYQNTGSLGLDPYVTFAKNFCHLPDGYGSFNAMGEIGYSGAVDSKRTEFLHMSGHLDYDVAGLHHIYPLIEINYFHYTRLGKADDFGTEGGDMFNFGSDSNTGGRDLVTLALGTRYKFNECFQVGVGIEFPLTSQKALADYRIGVDFIFRY